MFLANLIRRVNGEAPSIEPRRASRFESAAEPEPQAAMETEQPLPQAARGTVRQPTPLPSAPDNSRLPEQTGEATPRRTPYFDPLPAPVPARAEAPELAAPLPPQKPWVPADVALEPRNEGRDSQPLPLREPVVPRAAGPEVSRETVIREIVESHPESRIIERKLESLRVEHTVEKTEQRPAIAVSPAAPRETRRGAIVPDTRPSAPARPALVEAPPPASASSVVHVTIGRVEVKAAPPAQARRDARNREPKLDLGDYLQRRERA